MLHIIFSWRTYRVIKSGFLLDFYVKNFANIFFKYVFISFSIFFFDRYLLELSLYLLAKATKFINNVIGAVSKETFIKYFTFIVYSGGYFGLLMIIIFI